MLAAIPSIQPVKNNDLTRIASGYGMRTDPFDKSRKCMVVSILQHLEIHLYMLLVMEKL